MPQKGNDNWTKHFFLLAVHKFRFVSLSPIWNNPASFIDFVKNQLNPFT